MDRALATRRLALMSVCVVLNLGLGFLVASLKLPFYLDSIGTVLATALGGLPVGVLTAVASVLVGSLYTPTLWAYVVTGIAIALYVNAFYKLGYLKRLLPTLVGGLGLGIVTAVVSAPVTVVVWKGASLAGADAVTAFFSATGRTLADSVVLGGLATDPVDKLFTSLIALTLLSRVPRAFHART